MREERGTRGSQSGLNRTAALCKGSNVVRGASACCAMSEGMERDCGVS